MPIFLNIFCSQQFFLCRLPTDGRQFRRQQRRKHKKTNNPQKFNSADCLDLLFHAIKSRVSGATPKLTNHYGNSGQGKPTGAVTRKRQGYFMLLNLLLSLNPLSRHLKSIPSTLWYLKNSLVGTCLRNK